MDCENTLGLGEPIAVPSEARLYNEGQQGGLPIIGMDDIWRKTEMLTRRQRRIAKDDVPKVLVRVFGVDALAVIQAGAIDEMNLQVGLRQGGRLDRVDHFVGTDFDLDAFELGDRFEHSVRGSRATIQRSEDENFVTSAMQLGRKGRAHVRKPAYFGEGCDFGGDESDLHDASIVGQPPLGQP